MSENYISAIHVQKLGHQLQEIRERALFSIVSKLNRGFLYDNDLARKRELLEKLLDWFLFEPCTQESEVLKLIKRILESDSDNILINHLGPQSLKEEVKKIRNYVESKFHQQIDDILSFLENNLVPPLETDIPLSYRSGESKFSAKVGTTATTIEGFYYKLPSPDQGDCQSKSSSTSTLHIEPNLYMTWQHLIESDCYVLTSFENTIKDPAEPLVLINSFQFFNEVLLHDFPAEIFLQRPKIVQIFHNLIPTCPSNTITNEILKCLINLTRSLQVRINQYIDPCLNNFKTFDISPIYASYNSPTVSSNTGNEDLESGDNAILFKNRQMPLPEFGLRCFKAVFQYLLTKTDSTHENKPKLNQVSVNFALITLEQLVGFMKMVINKNIWRYKTNLCTLEQLNEILIHYGDILHYYRVEAICKEANLNLHVVYLFLLHNCLDFLDNFIDSSQIGWVLPKNLKELLSNILCDVTFARFYPKTHGNLLKIVESFSIDEDLYLLKKFRETNNICANITANREFLRTKPSNASNSMKLAKKALPCLDVYVNLDFITKYVELCASNIPLYLSDENFLNHSEFVTLHLLAHNNVEIRLEMYKLCHKRVISAIGPKLNVTGAGVSSSQILFLVRPKILLEIAMFGLIDDDVQIRTFSEDILIHLVKCKILVADDVWSQVVEVLMVVFPILLCFTTKKSCLGRNLIHILDPDAGLTLSIPTNEIFKANVILLFSEEQEIRAEAFSRLCWLLAGQKDSNHFLPRLNNLHDKSLPNVCDIKRNFDINKNRITEHFYQASSLIQVVQLLKSSNIEPVIRRSALTQINVIMEDHLLHSTFLEHDGVGLVVEILMKSLDERQFTDYADSAVPIIGILKNLCLFQAHVRQELSIDDHIYYWILRAQFMFYAEERLRQDATYLLFLLLYNDFVSGTPSKGNFSMPYLVSRKIRVPFVCQYHDKRSQFCKENIKELLKTDPYCKKSIQIEFNSDLFGGFYKLLEKDEVYYEEDVDDWLKLTKYDLYSLKALSIHCSVKKYLRDIQNGTKHEVVVDVLHKLSSYFLFYKTYMNDDENTKMISYPWESTFSRFLHILPSSEEDVKLLSGVLNFLKILTHFYKCGNMK